MEEFGSASANKALIKAYDGDFNRAEHTSLPITLLILLIAFGSLVAAGVPLLLGFTAVIGALGLIKPISHLYPVAQGQIEPVVLLVGLAVGVDYSMFYLRRKLEERHAGLRRCHRPRPGRGHLGAGGVDLRTDRDDRHGRDAAGG